MLPARDDSHRQYPLPSEPLCAYVHDLMLVAEYYESRCRDTADLVARHIPELQKLRTILYDPCRAASASPRLSSGMWLTPWEWRTLWPWIAWSFWRWRDTKLPIGDPLVRHLSFGCPVALASKAREDLKKRLKKLQKINATEASWLERYSRLLPEDNNSKCSAALYVVEHFSSASHTQDTLLKVEVRLAHPTNDSKKSPRHTHNCGTHMLDTHVWQEPLPAFLNKILKGAPKCS